MAHSSFSLYKRRSRKASGFRYYVQFWNAETSSYETGLSVDRLRALLKLNSAIYSSSRKADARFIAQAWIAEHGTAKASVEVGFGTYCLSFWDWAESEYLRGLRLRGKKIGKEYVGNNLSYIRRFLVPSHLGETSLSKVTSGALESLILGIKETTGLSNTSCNAILCAIGKPLAEAERLGLIRENPIRRVNKLVKDNTKKGVLSSSEIHALCSTPWDDERVKAAALLSLLCGLRLGEILGLQKDSIAEDRLTVRDSYGKKDGLKTTKNGKSRIVYLPSIIKLMLQQLIDTNPHNDAWVFWSEKAGVPINIRTVEKAFYIQLGKIGIFDANSSQEQKKQGATRQDRNITFHSLRHLYNTLLRGAIPDEILRESTGHLTASMTERYDHADHDSRIRALEVAVNERILTIIDA